MARVIEVLRDPESQQVLGVDKSPACLAETLRRLLLAETEYVDALLANTGREPGKIAVGGNQAETVEPAAVQQIHRVDDERDVRGILACRVGELLLGYDCVLRKDVGPRFRA